MPPVTPQLERLVAGVVADAGFDLEEITVARRDGTEELTIVVDRDGGGDLDVLAELSEQISTALDADPDFSADPEFAAAYSLEVTSPGVDRPLTLPRHWRRALGRKVVVELDDPARTLTGRVGQLEDEHAVTIVANHRGRIASERIDLNSVTKAVVQVDFSRPSVAELELCGLDASEIAARRKDA